MNGKYDGKLTCAVVVSTAAASSFLLRLPVHAVLIQFYIAFLSGISIVNT